MSAAAVSRALKAWRESDAASSWPAAIDTILLADWNGEELVWPKFDGEAFDIVRLSDSSVVDEVSLTPEQAQRLEWRVERVDPMTVAE